MAKFLQDLLDAKEPMFSTALRHLERAAGESSVDVRLISDIIAKAHVVMRRIGLDPADTTRIELYNALVSHAKHEELFADTTFVGLVYDGQVISFNYADVQTNSSQSFDNRTTEQMQCMLQHELVRRYSVHARTDDRSVEQFARDAGLNVCYSIVKHKHKQTEEPIAMVEQLSKLLDAEEPIFTQAIDQLVAVSHKTDAVDLLAAELGDKMKTAKQQLGLDPEPTDGKELYQALIDRMASDNERVTRLLGGTDGNDVQQMVPLLIDAANNVEFDRKVFVLKHSKAKDMLRQMPPRKLMERLGYDDVEALFAGEDFDELYTALRFSEGEEWLNEYNELFKTITADDYEERDIRILQMDHDKYVDLAEKFTEKKLHNVTHTKELGVIIVVPLRQTHSKGITLKTLPLLLHYLNEIKLYSNFFKLKSTNENFGETVVQTLIAELGAGEQIVNGNIHWRVIQRYFAKLKAEAPKEAFEPHVHPEDLHWRKAEDLLYLIDPEMTFWKDNDYVAADIDGHPVTLNFIDVSLSYANDISYDHRYVYHFRESLWNEIFIRFMGYDNLENQVLQQLDNDMIAPETLTVGA